MKILIIGGTMFYGRHLTQLALSRGHDVTLFNRGKHSPDLFAEAEKLRGDRNADLSPLKGRSWDVVIDTCGMLPRGVLASVEALRDAAEHYTFISSISVYSDFSSRGIDESGPVVVHDDDRADAVTNETYGPMKARCEEVALNGFPGRSLVIRPGLIVGPYDPTDRFTYWPVRVARGGDVLAPVGPQVPVQFIDARDLAEWSLDMVERRATGTFNATGPERPLTLGEVLATSREVASSDARVVWAPREFLTEHGVGSWIEMPLWVDDAEGEGMNYVDASMAIAEGLRFRPLDETVRDTLDWFAKEPPRELRAGVSPEREQELLSALRAGVA